MALRTKNIPLKPGDLDEIWTFRYFLPNCPPLTGGNVKIKSPFARDSDPSFSLYVPNTSKSRKYRWHCLATGLKGDCIDLVRYLRTSDINAPLNRDQAFRIIQKEYQTEAISPEGWLNYEKTVLLKNTKGRVTDWELRLWKKEDYEWWAQFGIGAKTLEKYNVAPMKSWKMHKIKDGEELNMTFNNPRAFGYLKGDGTLDRIYQPGMKGAKFIKVGDYYLQGCDALTFQASELLIMSSLKDIMAFEDLGFEGFEYIAPDSENILVRKNDMELLMEKYPRIRTFFDWDKAGIDAACKYKDQYGIETITLPLSKDLSDSIRDHNQLIVKLELLSLL